MGPALLFCPANRPDRFAKAAERADAVILDLEDAVAPADREAARRALVEHSLDPATTIVRVNPFDTDDFALDVEAVRQSPYRTVMLAKATNAAEVEALHGFDVIALCETAEGVLAAESIAEREHVVALMWGAEDLIASLGGTSSRRPDGSYRSVASHARSAVLLAARAHDTSAIDTVHFDIADLDGLALEAEDAAASGFAATACIHPGQVATIRSAYRPTAEQIDSARAVLAAAEQQPGVFRFAGRMIDEPVLRNARTIVARGGGFDTRPSSATQPADASPVE
jgi:citrate lyase subunit beta/citryl-CoA lyase